MKPTIHVTNWSSRKLHGPGAKYTIMARPRHWERGNGAVGALVPNPLTMEAARSGRVSIAEYRTAYQRWVNAASLAPGDLFVDGVDHERVTDGDTLCCACSKAAAARGECHRVWAAEMLAEAGWRVVLDGVSP